MMSAIARVERRRKELLAIGGSIVNQIKDDCRYDRAMLVDYLRLRQMLGEMGVCTDALHASISEEVGGAINIGKTHSQLFEDLIKAFPKACERIDYAEIRMGDVRAANICINSIMLNAVSSFGFLQALNSINTLARHVSDPDFTLLAISMLNEYSDCNQLCGIALQDVVVNVANMILMHADDKGISTKDMDKCAARLFAKGYDKKSPAQIRYNVIDDLLSSNFKLAGISAYKYLNFLPASVDTYVNLYRDHGVYGSEASNLDKIDWAPANSIFPAAGLIKLKLAKGDSEGYSEILNRVADKHHPLLEQVIIATSTYPKTLDDAFKSYADAVFGKLSHMNERSRSKLLTLFDSNDNGVLFQQYARESGKYSRIMINHELSI